MSKGNDNAEEGVVYEWKAGVGVTKREKTEAISTHERDDRDKPKGASDFFEYIKGRPR